MPRILIISWALLAGSLVLNVSLWRSAAGSPGEAQPAAIARPPSPPPFQVSAVKSDSHVATPESPPTARPSSLSTLQSTATRSAAFHGYADLLAEDVKTHEQLTSLHNLLARWVATDPSAAASWLAQHDDAAFYDPAALHIANHLIAAQRFAEARAWADLIRHPDLRIEALEAILAESYRAKKIDADALRLSGLPSVRIEAILNGSRLD
jgi:hypothetical protein